MLNDKKIHPIYQAKALTAWPPRLYKPAVLAFWVATRWLYAFASNAPCACVAAKVGAGATLAPWYAWNCGFWICDPDISAVISLRGICRPWIACAKACCWAVLANWPLCCAWLNCCAMRAWTVWGLLWARLGFWWNVGALHGHSKLCRCPGAQSRFCPSV